MIFLKCIGYTKDKWFQFTDEANHMFYIDAAPGLPNFMIDHCYLIYAKEEEFNIYTNIVNVRKVFDYGTKENPKLKRGEIYNHDTIFEMPD